MGYALTMVILMTGMLASDSSVNCPLQYNSETNTYSGSFDNCINE